MGFISSSSLAIGAAAAVLVAIIIASHDLVLEILRKYCMPTPEEAEWAAAFFEISDEDVEVLSYGKEQLGGAESFLEEPEGTILTGLWDGRIVRLLNETDFQHVASTGQHHGTSCSLERQKHEHTRCSRVLGLQFSSIPTKGDKSLNLVVCDGWRGLLHVPVPSRQEIEQGALPTLPSATKELLKGKNSAALNIANAITEEINGRCYVTDSSSRSDAGRFGLIVFEGEKYATGRLLSVDLKKDQAEVVGEGIPFANGAVLTYNKSGVLVAALNARQIRLYPLKPSHPQDWKLFTSLPVPPDNLTRIEVNGKRLYAAVSYGAPFLPFFAASNDSAGLFEQFRAAVWIAFSRATRSLKPFPVFGGLLFPIMKLLPSSFFNQMIKFWSKRSKRGGQVVFFDENGKLYRWLSLPAKCQFSAEVKLHRWPGASEPVMLVGAFSPEQPLCQVRVGKYI